MLIRAKIDLPYALPGPGGALASRFISCFTIPPNTGQNSQSTSFMLLADSGCLTHSPTALPHSRWLSRVLHGKPRVFSHVFLFCWFFWSRFFLRVSRPSRLASERTARQGTCEEDLTLYQKRLCLTTTRLGAPPWPPDLEPRIGHAVPAPGRRATHHVPSKPPTKFQHSCPPPSTKVIVFERATGARRGTAGQACSSGVVEG